MEVNSDKHEREFEHEHDGAMAEYLRLGLMALAVAVSLNGWWRNWCLATGLLFAVSRV
jgi:hypothetical protein